MNQRCIKAVQNVSLLCTAPDMLPKSETKSHTEETPQQRQSIGSNAGVGGNSANDTRTGRRIGTVVVQLGLLWDMFDPSELFHRMRPFSFCWVLYAGLDVDALLVGDGDYMEIC